MASLPTWPIVSGLSFVSTLAIAGCTSPPARIRQARAVLRVDVNVGDPVTPGPVQFEYPGLLGGSFHLLGYPIATVIAEKLVTIIDRGAATTRERDFAGRPSFVNDATRGCRRPVGCAAGDGAPSRQLATAPIRPARHAGGKPATGPRAHSSPVVAWHGFYLPSIRTRSML